MKLVNPTDDELNAAFAEKVCGWTLHKENISVNPVGYIPHIRWMDKEEVVQFNGEKLDFTASASSVLPWLEAAASSWSKECDGSIWCEMPCNRGTFRGSLVHEQPFARAAVIALLRAHGVEIEFTE